MATEKLKPKEKVFGVVGTANFRFSLAHDLILSFCYSRQARCNTRDE